MLDAELGDLDCSQGSPDLAPWRVGAENLVHVTRLGGIR